jgi:hypothetical protein
LFRWARLRRLLSREHFSVDGTLIEAWASMKSFRPKDDADGPPPGGGPNDSWDFHGEQRRNDTHASTTDPEARLFRKGAGKGARLCFMGQLKARNSLQRKRCYHGYSFRPARPLALS